MDLSHWDVVTFFSRDQIAQLLAGVDPNGGPYSKLAENKVKLYRDVVDIAINTALYHAWEHVRGLIEPPDIIEPDIFEFDPWDDELPSYEIRCSVADVLRDPANVPILQRSDPWYTEKFQRYDVHVWTIRKGLTKGYRFDGIANDRIPDVIQQAPFTTESLSEESLSDELGSAFDTQLDALLNRYWAFADHLKLDRDVRRFYRIGNWQRIIILDRLEDGEEFLTKSDVALLLRVGANGMGGYVLDDDPANREWQLARYSERWVAFGIHVYCRIISGEATTDEAVFLFRLASEMLGVIEHGDLDESREDGLVQNARAAANARHSRPGGSRDKRKKIQEIWESGKYSSRDICAEQECAALEMSFSAARKALRGTPDPT